jgi:RNA polymerase sigma-70 factor (ECF subfamily)
MEVNEANYLAQMKKRNRKALEFIIDHYGSLVYGVVRRVLHADFAEPSVEECINDVFWSVWNNIESFDEARGEFQGWLAAVAKYKAIDYKRKLSKQSAAEWFADCELRDEATTENIVISKENKRELFAAINSMNDQDREIFIRRYFLSEKIENIARAFSVNRSVVDQRLSRGRKFLRKKLDLKGEVQ